MTSLTILHYGFIRETEDGRYSVYDTIEVLAGKKNPRDAWKSVYKQYPEVVVKTDNFQFPQQLRCAIARDTTLEWKTYGHRLNGHSNRIVNFYLFLVNLFIVSILHALKASLICVYQG
jgi:hypothetical protein